MIDVMRQLLHDVGEDQTVIGPAAAADAPARSPSMWVARFSQNTFRHSESVRLGALGALCIQVWPSVILATNELSNSAKRCRMST